MKKLGIIGAMTVEIETLKSQMEVKLYFEFTRILSLQKDFELMLWIISIL